MEFDIRKILAKQAWATFVFTLLIALAITIYFNYQMDELRGQANSAIVDLQTKLDDLNNSSKAELQRKTVQLRRSIDDQFSLFEKMTNAMRAEYTQKNGQLLDLIGQIEEKKDLELSQIKEEIKGINVKSGDFSSIVNDVIKAIVSISTSAGQGSGVFVAGDGYLVTNNHVVEGSTFFRVRTNDGRSENARLVNKSAENDLALLKIDGKYTALEFDNSLNLKVGERVIALGSPSGLDFTVTEGIVSAVDRVIRPYGFQFIQTDVPINPGNSGGPLVNNSSKIVGINLMKVKGAESLGFAIPSNLVKATVMPWVEQDRLAEEAKNVQNSGS